MSRTTPASPSTPDVWIAKATAWVDARLAELGRERVGPLDVGRSRPWGRVAQVPTGTGPVWLKVPARSLWFELALVSTLSRLAPPIVPAPLAVDHAHGRLLLPDQGLPLADAVPEADLPDRFTAALVEVGRLQRAAAAFIPDLLTAGVLDLRPGAVPGRFDALLADGTFAPAAADVRAPLVEACAELARSGVAPSVDHSDLHDGNVLVDAAGRVTVLDWGDSVVAHPFAVLLVAERVLVSLLGDVAPDHPAVLAARRAYLAVFAADSPGEDLERTARLAMTVAAIGRATVWHRILATFAAARETPPDDWAHAPREWLERATAALTGGTWR